VTASAAVMGPIIPPSIAMIMYGYLHRAVRGKTVPGRAPPRPSCWGRAHGGEIFLVFPRIAGYAIRPSKRSLRDVRAAPASPPSARLSCP